MSEYVHSPSYNPIYALTDICNFIYLRRLFSVFIADLTARAYIDSPKRRTLTKIDVARAARQTDMFDFLIDILPREGTTTTSSTSNGNAEHSRRNSLNSQI
jgi:hypothetical protein